MPGLEQAIKNQLQGFPVLEGFAVGQHHGLQLEALQRLGQPRQIQRGDGFVGDDCDLPTTDVSGKQFALIQQIGADIDGVATVAQIYMKSVHTAPAIKRALE
ncbi:hypothetical protein D9M70_222130 [compost metagenome]